MSEGIAAALITGGISLLSVLISSFAAVKKSTAAISTAQAVTQSRLEDLTREVHEHNCVMQRLPVVEEQIRVIRHRLTQIESTERFVS